MTLSTIPKSWFQNQILTWFRQHGRHDLPWKQSMNPYNVWVSEIMLQQTQVSTVIPYFSKFMKSFPTLTKLSQASLDAVLAHWAGLGYYARGRNLHKTATIIVDKFAGVFPNTVDELITLPGIGLSTAGAIVAQAFNQHATICDGNVKRVLSRFHCVSGAPTEKKVESILWDLASFYTPKKQVADYTQAIMDIGATICTRSSPNCSACPLQKRCQAYLENKQAFFPEKKLTKAIPTRTVYMLCALNTKAQLLLQQRPTKGIWGGLWSLPEFSNKTLLNDFIRSELGIKSFTLSPLEPMKHSFSHFHLDMKPMLIHVQTKMPKMPTSFLWVTSDKMKQLGLPAPIKKIVKYDSIDQKQRII